MRMEAFNVFVYMMDEMDDGWYVLNVYVYNGEENAGCC